MASRKSAPRYDERYYRFYDSDEAVAYERNDVWLGFFGHMAERIVQDFRPRTALDAGCAMGFLVESLRDRGVEAFGVDVSEFAISQVREDIRPACRVGTITEPFGRRYDLIVCLETLEHLPATDGERAIDNICAHTDDVLFSSTPVHFKVPSHLNVRPVEHWAEQFARHGFIRDLDSDVTWVSRWSVRFRRSGEPLHRVVAGYERTLWRLTSENAELRELALDNSERLAELERLAEPALGRVAEGVRRAVRRLFPRATRRGAVLTRLTRRV